MMDRKMKILFLIHDLGHGGAEKVLVNLVNNMDLTKFDISLISLFGGGVNEQFLRPEIHYKAIFPELYPANSQIMKVLSPTQLHNFFVKEKFDVEISYLEGPSARIISGCPDKNTKLISWIHVEQHDMKTLSYAFRTKNEAKKCYDKFDKTICVSNFVKEDFCKILNFQKPITVLYNTVESEKIRKESLEAVKDIVEDGKIRLVAVGTLKESKGYGRLLNIVNRLNKEGYLFHLYILGEGSMRNDIEQYIQSNHLNHIVTLLGYQTNPYKYVANCDLFVCASFAEGFSTAVTESLILGTPVCTVEVSGMKELLGEKNEYGLVTGNTEEELYHGLKKLLDDKKLFDYYTNQAQIRGNSFETKSTVAAVEKMLFQCVEE